RHIPNLTVMAPKDDLELKTMLELALKHNGPSAIRYPRGKVSQSPSATLRGEKSEVRSQKSEFGIGKGEILKEGSDMALIAIGNAVHPALGAAERLEKEGIKASVINARFIKPLDKELFLKIASKTKRIITVEENMIAGGFGSAVLEYLNSVDIPDIKIKILGIPDEFVEQGSQAILRKKYGIDEEGIYQTCKAFLSALTSVH
ncbi:MAG: 1-deoxy-D-xylulose-5-phosphate synthase, partial [Nitrospirae bacterium]|nr:1-deoxy-D-xylulose-5-phosphate synthase [Nitrospirota bacterium]